MRKPELDAELDRLTDEIIRAGTAYSPYITTHVQLNVAERATIAAADLWAFPRKRNGLDEAFLLNLHKLMLKGV